MSVTLEAPTQSAQISLTRDSRLSIALETPLLLHQVTVVHHKGLSGDRPDFWFCYWESQVSGTEATKSVSMVMRPSC